MNGRPSEHSRNQLKAQEAYRALGPSPSEHVALAVHCASGHHVAAVYDTPGGLVFAAHQWSHSHGDRDRHDAAHHGGHRDALWFDWLVPSPGLTDDDPLPAGCECGQRSLSRSLLRAALAAGDRRLVID
jgi:hypothetical protein